MDNKTTSLLFALLRSAVCGTYLAETEKKAYTCELLKDLLKTTARHDLTHLLVLGLKKNGMISKDNIEMERYILKAVYRYERIQYEYEKICGALEKAQILFLPLKGSVIRKYYPEAWMRTSCDIDILLHEKDTEKATAVLVNEYGYTFEKKGTHDLSLFSPSRVHLELHYDLVEDWVAKRPSQILKTVWDTATVRSGCHYWLEMPDDMYYFYHIAHMAKHFENGGCGVRPLLDLWILDNVPEANQEKRDLLLREGKLLKFAQVARKLSRVWLEGEIHDPLSQRMEDYILRGGAYGIKENAIAVQQQKKGGRIGYVLSKVFLPYEIIKIRYPVLQKHRWLTPFMEVRRWFEILFFRKRFSHAMDELERNANVSAAKAKDIQDLLRCIGLREK